MTLNKLIRAMLQSDFFDRDALQVAKDLLGKVIYRRYQDIWLTAQIIETEAYYLAEKGSHASLGYTQNRRALFMPLILVLSIDDFWQEFDKQKLIEARKIFLSLNNDAQNDAQQTILLTLFQQSALSRKPILISVLERELKEENEFENFYQAWLPPKEAQNPIEVAGEYYLQTFPTPVRVINAVDIKDPKRVFSVGLTWIRDSKEEQGLWEFIKKAEQGQDEANEQRSESISSVADGKLLGLFQVKTDDNLGTPF